MIARFTRAPQRLERFGLDTDRRRILYAFGAAILLFLLGELVHPGFAAFKSVESILIIASFVGLVAAGQTFVILIGGIDLSVPWVLNGAAILMVTSSLGKDENALYAIAVTLGMGLAVGLLNGLGIAFLSVPAVVMTLGMNGLMEGLTLGLSDGMTCHTCASYAPPVVRNTVHGNLFGISTDILFWIAVTLLVSFVLSYTVFGRRTYALGNNPQASYLAGINVKLLTVALYMLSGMFSALAGIALVGFGGQASLGMGDPFLFQSIAAVVIGGVYILGGRGHYLGTAAGAVTLVALLTVLMAVNMPEYGRNIIYGVVILLLLLLYGRQEQET